MSEALKPGGKDPWTPPKAALEPRKAASPPLSQETGDARGALRAMLFAPALVIGPVAVLFMLMAGGAWYAVAALTVYFGWRLYRR
ncbi:hypothetical protein EG831_01860 [bacterium]|nr:hypothetical protein [bacterium]